jgi:hypothetical protein
MFKKIIMTGLIGLSSIFANSLNTPLVSGSTIQSPYFQNFEAGVIPSEYTYDLGSSVVSIDSVVTNQGRYSLKVSGGDESFYNGARLTLENENVERLSYWVRVQDSSETGGYFLIKSGGSSLAWLLLKRGTVYLNGIENGLIYSNRWHKVEVQLDWTGKTIDVLLDETLIMDDVAMQGTDPVGVSSIELFNYTAPSVAYCYRPN